MIRHTWFKSVRFFLWGYLKSKVSSNRPQSIEQLKDVIRQEITAILHEMTRRVIDNFRERLRQCVDNKMELDAVLLNTQHYKVRMKGKVEQSREWSSALFYTSI